MRFATSVKEDIEHINKKSREFVRVDSPNAVAVFREMGAARNKERAAMACHGDAERRHYRVEETPAGGYIAEQKLPPDEHSKLVGHAQLNMASAARGNVETFVAGAAPESLFRNGTMQMLFDNPAVTHINGIGKELLARGSDEDRFHAVCASELMRDLERGDIRSIEQPGALYHGASADPRLVPPPPSFADPNRTPEPVLRMVEILNQRLKIAEREKASEKRRQRDRDNARSRSGREER